MLHPLQLSGFTFIPVIYLCYQYKHYAFMTIMLLMFITTEYSHKSDRDHDYNIVDYIDLSLIALWAIYNFTMVMTLLVDIFHNKSCDIENIFLVLLSCICAVMCIFLDIVRRKYNYRHPIRTRLHIVLHSLGSIGTIVLLNLFHSTRYQQ